MRAFADREGGRGDREAERKIGGTRRPRVMRGAPGGVLLMSLANGSRPSSALGVRRGAGELDADERLITDDTGIVPRRDRVRVAFGDGDPGAIGHPGLELA